MGHFRPFFFIYVFATATSKTCSYKFLPMTGFEPRTSGIGKNALQTEPQPESWPKHNIEEIVGTFNCKRRSISIEEIHLRENWCVHLTQKISSLDRKRFFIYFRSVPNGSRDTSSLTNSSTRKRIHLKLLLKISIAKLAKNIFLSL